MRRILIAACAAAGLATLPALADQKPTDEDVARIMELLAGMQCEMDEDEIEKEDDGSFELDDVFCADGQYDMELSPAFEVVEKRKE